ncbi:hypothetical protein Micbo1qcDRAFT_171247 [Microdochium bolleyi]|uniref:Uncharacterized protein n=1 Tax=Microdochium bolleyi TaxID=196109 RepID=A0A136JKC4_9PEZI|nr:hypothetical protein Micbo1qcDRAFT_171247 [Microdochium bolleyi]
MASPNRTSSLPPLSVPANAANHTAHTRCNQPNKNKSHVRPSLSGWIRSSTRRSSEGSGQQDQQSRKTSSSSTASRSLTLSPVATPSLDSGGGLRSPTRHSTTSSPTTNVYTHCGRHTDQFLFGGRSMSDFWKSAFVEGENRTDRKNKN